jgi:hypothetical protein
LRIIEKILDFLTQRLPVAGTGAILLFFAIFVRREKSDLIGSVCRFLQPFIDSVEQVPDRSRRIALKSRGTDHFLEISEGPDIKIQVGLHTGRS